MRKLTLVLGLCAVALATAASDRFEAQGTVPTTSTRMRRWRYPTSRVMRRCGMTTSTFGSVV
ncbi:MAG TPA: hypothetical protein PLS53_10435 [Thermoanaerobaculaceae bacterium]|nr:hypothetical protein [Thermoanaerobaculaceae bacterium]